MQDAQACDSFWAVSCWASTEPHAKSARMSFLAYRDHIVIMQNNMQTIIGYGRCIGIREKNILGKSGASFTSQVPESKIDELFDLVDKAREGFAQKALLLSFRPGSLVVGDFRV